jgi:putative MATE family efflux protein
MSAPLMVSFTMRAAFTFVDTIYAATIGDSAVAAIGLTVPFEFLMIALWVGLSTGLTSVLSRAMASGEHRKVDQYLASCWRLVAIASPVFALMGIGIWFFSPLVDLQPDVLREFRIYGTTLIVGAAFTTFWSVIPDSVIKAHQDTRSTMWAGIWSNVINVVLNTVFLFVFGWGVFGIALSTVLGRIGGLVYATARARAHERGRRASDPAPSCDPDPHPYRAIFGLAVPASLTFALMALETLLINGILAHLEHPKEALASYSIYYRVVLFTLNPVIAISVAMLPYAARRFGRADFEGVRTGLRDAARITATYAVVLVGPVLVIGAPWFAEWLTESPLSARYTTTGLRLVPLACLVSAPFLLCRPVFEGMQRGRPGLIMAIVRYLVLTVPLAWAGSRAAVWLGQPQLYGMLTGLLGAAALSSAAFALWLRRALPRDVGV